MGSPPTPAGSPAFFGRKPEERTPGASPWTPFLWPLVPTRWFLGQLSLIRLRGYFFRYTKTDLERIFRGKICWKEFSRKKVSKSGHVHGTRNSLSTGTMRHPTPKRASANERALNQGGAGGHPPRLFASGLSLEKAWIPRPGPGGEPRCRSGPAQVQKEPPADSAAAPKGSVSPHPLTRETW